MLAVNARGAEMHLAGQARARLGDPSRGVECGGFVVVCVVGGVADVAVSDGGVGVVVVGVFVGRVGVVVRVGVIILVVVLAVPSAAVVVADVVGSVRAGPAGDLGVARSVGRGPVACLTFDGVLATAAAAGGVGGGDTQFSGNPPFPRFAEFSEENLLFSH